MGLFETLHDIYDKIVDETGDNVAETFDSIEDLAAAIVESFDDGKEAFEAIAQQLLANDPGSWPQLNETLIELLLAVIHTSDDAANQIKQLLRVWVNSFSNLTLEIITGFLTAVFEALKNNTGGLLMVLEQLLSLVGDFEDLFKALVTQAANDLSNLKQTVEVILLPLVGAALQAGFIGPSKLAQVVISILTDVDTWANTKRPLSAIGIQPNSNILQGLYDSPGLQFRSVDLVFISVLENIRVGMNLPIQNNFSLPDNPFINYLFEPAISFFSDVLSSYFETIQALVISFIEELITAAENDEDLEWFILGLARFTPVGLLFLLVAIPYKFLTSPAPFTKLILNPIEDDPDLEVLRLPAPSNENKYIVFSDIHRDAKSDQAPPFQCGSIDHFLPNQNLYEELLDYYSKEGYTIIEAGDCEELWFHRDFDLRPHEKLEEIINETHESIYEKLADLHKEGRYYRIYGNHDSYLRNQNSFDVLNQKMDPNGDHEFKIYDFIIIDGVKTMQDVPFFLGLDSEPNQEKKPFIITHGHQWDFWNNDQNNILGKLIVSAVVTPLDMKDDPLRDIAGISNSGSPLINFKSILSDTPIYNSWQSYEPAVLKADKVQHMEDNQRRFVDDVLYSETLASLMGNLLLIRNGVNGFDYDNVLPCFDSYSLFNLMCLGHTHNPQNEPYYDLKEVPLVGAFIESVGVAIEGATLGVVEAENIGLIKSNYLNTGISGWYDKTIWGIDLGSISHGTAQPKLVYWAANTRLEQPNEMNWELPHLSRANPDDPGTQLDEFHQDVESFISDLVTDLRRLKERVSTAVTAPVSGAMQFLEDKLPSQIHLPPIESGAGAGLINQLFEAFMFYLSALLANCNEAADKLITWRIHLPKELQKAIDRLLRVDHGHKLEPTDQIRYAIGMLLADQAVFSQGLGKHFGPDTSSKNGSEWKNHLQVLSVLASFDSNSQAPLSANFQMEKGELKVMITVNRKQIAKDKKRSK